MSESIKSKIRTVPNFPKEGIMFRDITTLIADKEGLNEVMDIFYERYKDKNIDVIAGIESRGFIFGSALAHKMGVGLVLIRKPGKLPFETISQEYDLEYGKDKIEIHKDAIKEGDNVLVIDDLLATGGTMCAACNLVEKLGGKIVECGFVIGLPELKGHEKLSKWPSYSITEFEGD
jgi:adenine phosphoribosyltransferase